MPMNNMYGGVSPYYNNPYQMANYQQPQLFQQPQPTRPSIPGRVVTSPDEITVQEVPTDGSIGYFPAFDGSCVYGKRWTTD